MRATEITEVSPDYVSDLQSTNILMPIILIGTVLLGVLYLVLYLIWGSGPVLAEVPSYNPMMFTFMALTSFSVAFLAFGRCKVLRDPVSFWIGMGFSGLGIGLVFYVMAWPGLLPDGRSIIAHLPNTAGVLSVLLAVIPGITLVVAALGRWPGEQMMAARCWKWLVVAWFMSVTTLYTVIVVFEQYLPVLVTAQGAFTTTLVACNAVLLLIYAVGAVLSARRHLLTKDALPGYVALFQVAFIFSSLSTIVGSHRYDLWWYLNRIILVSGSQVVLFGLLFEYVGLFQRERELKTKQLEFYRRTILAATGGKLHITSREDIKGIVGEPETIWEIKATTDIAPLRQQLRDIVQSAGMDEHDVNRLLTCCTEATANALKYAGGGIASLHLKDGALVLAVSDAGPGIHELNLPDVALVMGYSTAGTGGMGYKLMIKSADKVYLATGPEGTTIAVEFALNSDCVKVSV